MAYPINYIPGAPGGPVDPRDPRARPGYGYGGGNVGLLGNPLFNVGVGLLSQPQYSRYPRGPLEGIGKALQYAGETESAARRSAAENELYRERLAESQQERFGTQQFAEWMAKNPNATMEERMNAVMQFNPTLAAKGYASNIGNPTLAIEAARQQQLLETGKVEGQAKALDLEKEYGNIRQNFQQQHAALAALDTLEKIPGGSAALNAPKLVEMATSATGMHEFVDAAIKSGAAKIYGIPEEDFKRVLSAVFTINKATENIAANEQGAVAGQARAARGMGAGAPIDVRRNIYQSMFDETGRLLSTNPNWEVPPTHRYEFQGPEPVPTGVQDGRVVPQPPPSTTITPDPTVPRKTTTIPVDPATGYYKFTRAPDLERAIKSGVLKAGDWIVWNGEPRQLVAEPRTSAR